MCIPILQRSPGAIVGDSRADRRLQCGAAGPEPTTGLPEWPGLGRTSAQRRPRPAPGMRSPARTQREPRPPWRVKQALQAQPTHPARVHLNCLPVSPMPRRTATASRHSPLPARRAPRCSFASGPPPPPPRPQPTCPP